MDFKLQTRPCVFFRDVNLVFFASLTEGQLFVGHQGWRHRAPPRLQKPPRPCGRSSGQHRDGPEREKQARQDVRWIDRHGTGLVALHDPRKCKVVAGRNGGCGTSLQWSKSYAREMAKSNIFWVRAAHSPKHSAHTPPMNRGHCSFSIGPVNISTFYLR